METYLVTLHNPSANPEEYEEQYVDAEGQKDAELQAADIIANHVFDDVALVSVVRVDPAELYHEST